MITVALELLNEIGLEDLTLCRLAAKLDVQTPALYWHFKDKQELLDEMATTVFREGIRQISFAPGTQWERWAIAYGKSLRQVLLRHRDGAKMMGGTRLTDDSLSNQMEAVLRTLMDAGFSNYLSMVTLSTIYSYVVGFVIEEQAVCSEYGKRAELYSSRRRYQRVNSCSHPYARKTGNSTSPDLNRRFEDGLQAIVMGFALRNTSKTSPRSQIN